MLPLHQFKHNSNQNKKVEDHKIETKPQSKYKHLNRLNQLIKTNLNISSQKPNDQNKSPEQGTSTKPHRKTNWDDLPIEIQLKILKILNEIYQTHHEDGSKESTLRYLISRDTILPRGHLSRLLYVNKSFADLIRVFVWHSVNFTLASVPKLKDIEECILSSSEIAGNIKSVTFKWYQPQYNNIWENWFESPIYESNLKILKSLKSLIALELILNDESPYYSNLPIANEIKSIGDENLSDLLRFRLLTCWRVGLDDEELMTNLLKNSTGLKRFECHSADRGIKKDLNIKVDELKDNPMIYIPMSNERYSGVNASKKFMQAASSSSRNSIIKEKQNQLEIRLPKLLSRLGSLEYLAISTEACLDEDWIKCDWSQSQIKKLVLSDLKDESWETSLLFINSLSHTINKLVIHTPYGKLNQHPNESSSSLVKLIPLHLPALRSITIQVKVPIYLESFDETEFDFLSFFINQQNKIEEMNFIQESSMKIDEEVLLEGLNRFLNQITSNLIHYKSLKLIKFGIKCPKQYSESLHDHDDQDQGDDPRDMFDVNFTLPFKRQMGDLFEFLRSLGIHFDFLF